MGKRYNPLDGARTTLCVEGDVISLSVCKRQGVGTSGSDLFVVHRPVRLSCDSGVVHCVFVSYHGVRKVDVVTDVTEPHRPPGGLDSVLEPRLKGTEGEKKNVNKRSER